jgi:hypothetical protein
MAQSGGIRDTPMYAHRVKHIGIVACSAEGAALCYQPPGRTLRHDWGPIRL